ncbi:hypothetical protein CERZMDRAFT_88931 [Cercospora zeae-maydis SCOH1-5]|uniref:Uncharacterized protein n=1 Tax=Cercospora zeae-maydis SCOH1-5 TaxID=717836 RepID=A0A6A6EXJ8_9PEZI|nr:hypothetical protein CERZMDRAFT_88931 [Cercospora zeae-maydis SCOH1-5]
MRTHYKHSAPQADQATMTGLPSTIIDNSIQQTPDMANTFNLTELHPELVERIAEQAGNATLRSLRLTCSDVAAIVLRPYGEAHFASRTIMLCSKQSVLKAAEAAEHKDFGRHLRRLKIIVYDTCFLHQPPENPYSWDSRKQDLKLLFHHMSKHGKPVKLKFVEGETLQPRSFSFLAAHERGYTPDIPKILGGCQLEMILGAVRNSNVELSGLATRTNAYTFCLDKSFFHGSLEANLKFVLQHLRHLEMHYDASHSGDHGATTAFYDMICSAPKLESLKLRLKQRPRDTRHVFAGLLFERQLPQLKWFHLAFASIHMSDLQGFVRLNPTLQKVRLTQVDFMRGSFSDHLLGDFHVDHASDIYGPVRESIGLPGHYEDLWSDDVAPMEE